MRPSIPDKPDEKAENNCRFATSYILQSILECEPNLFNAAADVILSDLDFSYNLSPSSLSIEPELENSQQKHLRETMIETWLEDLDEDFKRTDEEFKPSHKKHFLSTLLFSIWKEHQNQYNLSNASEHAQMYTMENSKDPKGPPRAQPLDHLDSGFKEKSTTPLVSHGAKSIRDWTSLQSLELPSSSKTNIDPRKIFDFLL